MLQLQCCRTTVAKLLGVAENVPEKRDIPVSDLILALTGPAPPPPPDVPLPPDAILGPDMHAADVPDGPLPFENAEGPENLQTAERLESLEPPAAAAVGKRSRWGYDKDLYFNSHLEAVPDRMRLSRS